MKKPGKAKSSSRSKQPLSPAIAEVLSSVVTHEGSDDDHDQQGEQPFTTADGNGAKSARGGVTSGPPSTPAPVMVMDQDGVASFTSSILATLLVLERARRQKQAAREEKGRAGATRIAALSQSINLSTR